LYLIHQLSIEGVPNLFDICEPKSGIFPLLLAVELNKLNVIDRLFELGCAANTCDLSGLVLKLNPINILYIMTHNLWLIINYDI